MGWGGGGGSGGGGEVEGLLGGNSFDRKGVDADLGFYIFDQIIENSKIWD